MSVRLDYAQASPVALKALFALEAVVKHLGLEAALIAIVKLRASQINGCAFCIDMHYREARDNGETEQRLNLLSVWREVPFYTVREQAALEWTEAVTLVSESHVPEGVYTRACEQFSETELTNLTLAIVAINGWNRFSISFRKVPPLAPANEPTPV